MEATAINCRSIQFSSGENCSRLRNNAEDLRGLALWGATTRSRDGQQRHVVAQYGVGRMEE
jgi:hypothetical protein